MVGFDDLAVEVPKPLNTGVAMSRGIGDVNMIVELMSTMEKSR
jgi:hypothetical protein